MGPSAAWAYNFSSGLPRGYQPRPPAAGGYPYYNVLWLFGVWSLTTASTGSSAGCSSKGSLISTLFSISSKAFLNLAPPFRCGFPYLAFVLSLYGYMQSGFTRALNKIRIGLWTLSSVSNFLRFVCAVKEDCVILRFSWSQKVFFHLNNENMSINISPLTQQPQKEVYCNIPQPAMPDTLSSLQILAPPH